MNKDKISIEVENDSIAIIIPKKALENIYEEFPLNQLPFKNDTTFLEDVAFDIKYGSSTPYHRTYFKKYLEKVIERVNQ
jgi:hypothetical protein